MEMSGKELRRLMDAAGIGYLKMSKQIGMAHTTVRFWVKGGRPIGFVRSLGLAEYFRRYHKVESKWKPPESVVIPRKPRRAA